MTGLGINRYLDLLLDLGVDLVAVYVLAVRIYYRRHHRTDLLLAYCAINVGVYLAMSLMTSVGSAVGAGFGLFAILSIIQLRSRITQQADVAYYFAALVLGMINGVRMFDILLTVLLNIAVVAVVWAVDSRGWFDRYLRVDVTLDRVHTSDEALVADLEQRLKGTVQRFVIEDVDHVRETMLIDVRYVPHHPAEAFRRRSSRERT